MKPTSERIALWHYQWATGSLGDTTVSMTEYIAQRAAEWAFEEAAKIAGKYVLGSDGAEAIRKEIEND